MGNDESDHCHANICWNGSYPFDEINTNFNSIPKYKEVFGQLVKFEAGVEFLQEPCKLCETKKAIRIKPLSYTSGKNKHYFLRTSRYKHSMTLKVCNT